MHYWFYAFGGGVAFVFDTSQAINLGYKEWRRVAAAK